MVAGIFGKWRSREPTVNLGFRRVPGLVNCLETFRLQRCSARGLGVAILVGCARLPLLGCPGLALQRSHSSSRRHASSRVRPCGRGAAAATGCCSTSARRPLLGAEGPAHRGRHVAKGPYHARPSSRRGRALGGIGGASSARELLCDASFWRKKMAQGGEDKATGQISHFLWLFN